MDLSSCLTVYQFDLGFLLQRRVLIRHGIFDCTLSHKIMFYASIINLHEPAHYSLMSHLQTTTSYSSPCNQKTNKIDSQTKGNINQKKHSAFIPDRMHANGDYYVNYKKQTQKNDYIMHYKDDF